MKKLLSVIGMLGIGAYAHADFVVDVQGIVNQAPLATKCAYTPEISVWTYQAGNLKGEMRAAQKDDGRVQLTLDIYLLDENGQEQLAGTAECCGSFEEAMSVRFMDPQGEIEVINLSFVAHRSPEVQEPTAAGDAQVVA